MNSMKNRHASLDELAEEYNLPLDTLVSLQKIGLIRPAKIENKKPLFGPFSHLRIKFIQNARSHGLSFAEILSLIGKIPPLEDESAQILKSLKVGKGNATQLRRQIEISTPLEKVNRSCDLILLESYIENAKAMLTQEKKKAPPAPVPITHPPEPNPVKEPKLGRFPQTIYDEAQDEESTPVATKSVWRRLPLALCLIALLWVPFQFNTGDLNLLLEKGKQWYFSFLLRVGYGSSTSLPVQAASSEIADDPPGEKKPGPEILPEEDLRKPSPPLPGLKNQDSPPATSDSASLETSGTTTPGMGTTKTVKDEESYLGKIQKRIPVPTQKFIIQCEHDSIDIADRDKDTLDVIAEFVALYPTTRLVIRGYTDSQGDSNYNMSLSASRARQGKTLMVSKGISPLNIKTIGMGSANPIASNQTLEGRRMNRRIEVELVPEAMQ